VAMERVRWADVPSAVQASIDAAAGPVLEIDTVSGGLNCALAAVLRTPTGRIFVKGLPAGTVTQRREAALSRYVGSVSPRLLWEIRAHGWHVLAFTHIDRRHANYAPGSPDLPRVVEVVNEVGRLRCPELPGVTLRAEQRWAKFVDDPEFLAGRQLAHTDLRPDNVLVTDAGAARLVDWAWPTLGAPWIDAACWVPQLIAAGHDPSSAETWAGRIAAWSHAPSDALDRFAVAQYRMWEQIAQQDPLLAWKDRMASASREWMLHRN